MLRKGFRFVTRKILATIIYHTFRRYEFYSCSYPESSESVITSYGSSETVTSSGCRRSQESSDDVTSLVGVRIGKRQSKSGRWIACLVDNTELELGGAMV